MQVGATLQTSCYSVPHIMIGRFITGIGTGIETSTVPMYQAELCEARKRGRLVCSEALFVGLGIVIGEFISRGVSSTVLIWTLTCIQSVLFRLWNEFCWWTDFVAVAHCLSDVICLRKSAGSILILRGSRINVFAGCDWTCSRTSRISSIPIQPRQERGSSSDFV